MGIEHASEGWGTFTDFQGKDGESPKTRCPRLLFISTQVIERQININSISIQFRTFLGVLRAA